VSDRYESVSVHGLMPLVVDADTGMLRFAVLETDQPEDCLTSPDRLPEALVQFFVFGDEGRARAWADGIREVASNAVSVEFPATRFPKFALLVRHDAEPLRGETLEECVALRYVGHRHSERHPGVEAAEERQVEIERRREQGAEQAFRTRWAAEIAVIGSNPDAEVHIHDRRELDDTTPLTLRFRDARGHVSGGTQFDVSRDGSAYRIEWEEPKRFRSRVGERRGPRQWSEEERPIDDDLERGLVAKAAELGLKMEGDSLSRPIPDLHPATLASVRKQDDDFSRHVALAKKVQKGRDLAVQHLVKEKMVAILKRVVAGFPLVLSDRLGDVDQASPTTGRGMSVPGIHVRSASEAGLVEGVWTHTNKVFGDMHVFAATKAGRALLEDDPCAHALLFVDSQREFSELRSFVPKPSLAEAVGVLSAPPPRAVKALSGELDDAIDRISKHPSDRGAWSVAVAAVSHGLAEIGPDGLPRRLGSGPN
jgi:hypothetical protein